MDTTENAAVFTENNLAKYGAIIFLNTTGDILDEEQQSAFERYIQGGGGYVGIHAASDTEHGWTWYNKLAGARFLSHPAVQEGKTSIVNKNHPSMEHMPDGWKIRDEFYDFSHFNKDVNVLLTLDEKSYQGGKMGDFHPASWYHEFDGGKAWYTNFGHEDATFKNDIFLKHVLGGLNYVWANKIDYSKSRPEENRFTKHVLAEVLDEPTELVVLDDHRVLFTERKGALKLYDPKTQKISVVGQVPVYTKHEYGLMGFNIDPNFKENKWIYLFYSPLSTAADTSQHLSRFVYDDVNNKLKLETEKVLLKVPVKRTGCCHTGGSLEWDAKGNLYVSTGDDVNPFESDGYSPSDNRPDREGWDGMHTSSNTNDLRGKILRIKPQPDGTYTIPEGNLFPEGNPKARPEIYVMGNRNPYRISVDKKTGFLYWGEVGPDASNDHPERGPRGHDEVNQARKAGYFGWPLFVADNRAYNYYDFESKKSGEKYDAKKPINTSPHNTGLKELPPAQPAFIYYPYAASPEFGPVVGQGSRNAMAGPVYYTDHYDASENKFPDYYHGKFFAYDWTRDIINVVKMNKEGDLQAIERFMPNAKFSHPIDMQFAKDGSLYILEYGNKWFSENEDARLSRITFNAGNRPPVAIASASKTVGSVPLKVQFKAKGSYDHDGDNITYEWSFGEGLGKSTLADPVFTYTKAGDYTATLKVTDSHGNATTTKVYIKAGNETPKVDIAVKGNKSFYWNDKPISYEVKVTDKEDGSLVKGISADDVTMQINYLEGFDKTILAQGHQANTGFATGKRLIDLSDCKACHTATERSIGPSYREIAKKYENKAGSTKLLANKIIDGGGGVWGEQVMPPHPQHKESETEDMVKYILSLASDKPANTQPVKGDYKAPVQKKPGSYILTATYTDRGTSKVGPLTGTETVTLRPAILPATAYDQSSAIASYKLPEGAPSAGSEIILGNKSGAYIGFENIDLFGVKKIAVSALTMQGRTSGGSLEVRLGSVTGPRLGTVLITEANNTFEIPVGAASAVSKKQTVYFVYVNTKADNKPLFGIKEIEFKQ